MNDIERFETHEIDKWCREFMMQHPDATYTQAYNACKHELKAARYRDEQKAQKAYSDREVFIRNYQTETGATRNQALRHVEKFMPNLHRYGSAVQQIAALIGNPQHDNDEHALKSFLLYFQDNPDLAKRAAGEWVSEVANHIATHRTTHASFSQKLSEAMREVLSVNPDVSLMYERGVASESAVRTIFHFRFSDGAPYDVAANHGGISHLR